MSESNEQQVTVTTTDPIKYIGLVWQIGVIVFYGAVIWITSGQHTRDIERLRSDHENDIKETREHVSNLQSAVAELRGEVKCGGVVK